MEIENRLGIFVKYKNVVKTLSKSYFFIDTDGTLYYTHKESIINEALKLDNIKDVIELVKQHSKQIKLNTCSVSPSIKLYTEKNIPDMTNRSHLKLFEKTGNFRILILFALKEENTSNLYQIITGNKASPLSSFNDTLRLSPNKSSTKKLECTFYEEGPREYFTDISIDTIFRKDEKSADDVLVKIGGKYVHQKDFSKRTIKVAEYSKDENTQEHHEDFVTLENNSTYSGLVKNGMPTGIGKEFRADGNLYQGQFHEGKWHGEGMITNANLETYKGEFIDGCISGI
jgi:hypothetical protein